MSLDTRELVEGRKYRCDIYFFDERQSRILFSSYPHSPRYGGEALWEPERVRNHQRMDLDLSLIANSVAAILVGAALIAAPGRLARIWRRGRARPRGRRLRKPRPGARVVRSTGRQSTGQIDLFDERNAA